MPIRRKETGKKRGSKGFVFRIPVAEAGNLSEEEIKRNLREVYGTDELKVLSPTSSKPETFSEYFKYLARFQKFPPMPQQGFSH